MSNIVTLLLTTNSTRLGKSVQFIKPGDLNLHLQFSSNFQRKKISALGTLGGVVAKQISLRRTHFEVTCPEGVETMDWTTFKQQKIGLL